MDERHDLGQLEHTGDQLQLRFTRKLHHPPEKVWRALTEAEHLAAWFPTEIAGERATGAALRFTFRHGEGPTLDGQMLRYEPPSVLEFRWGDDDTLRFELQPDGDGSRLRFVNTFNELGKGARDAAGWHVCLDNLVAHLDGREPSGTPAERWHAVHSVYVARFGPEAATIGPPASSSINA
ncbi:MAG TPA: SRPBCC family protein [Chloroflexota bacterium]|nr:SRPBCC family protein [Chloroflexota bacterium]